jgi:hypothetical protein
LADYETAVHVVQALRRQRTDAWLDIQGVGLERRADDAILQAMSHSAVVVLMLSRRSLQRPWVQAEIAHALRQRLPLFVLLLDGCPVPPWVGAAPIFDLSRGPATALTGLARAVATAPRPWRMRGGRGTVKTAARPPVVQRMK